MYKVVIIEDEPWTLIGITKTFKWSEMGFEVIAQSTSAREAIDIIHEKSPDVVFTDIRMPQMSGIELMRKIRSESRDIEFVIISGFAEFEYAREAITLGAFEYCLKPVSKESADSILGRLAIHLDNKRDKRDIELFEIKNELENKICNENFKKLLEYIDMNYVQKLQLKDLAEKFYLNPNYCCYLFKNILQKSFSEYLTDKRMTKACDFLKDVKLPISEVAVRAGYGDYYYFNKAFKRQFGYTPLQYRQRQQ